MRRSDRDLRGAGIERRERGFEADERDRLYVRNAFATLSPTRELLRWGAWAGLHAGGAALALLAGMLLVLILALLAIGEAGGPGTTYYGPTPLVGTPFEILWPIVLALPVVPYYAVVGSAAALARRAGNRRRRALDHYFDPPSPLLDFLVFWLATMALVLVLAFGLALVGSDTSIVGLLILTWSAGGLLGRPLYLVWRAQYLRFIREHGSASLDDIIARIRAQL